MTDNLITGASQIGKSTICKEIADEYGYKYISLDDIEYRNQALNNPKEFINSLGANKIIIDEVQYAPILFDVLTSIVNKTRLDQDDATGMFILTSSQAYLYIKNVTESMAGRVNILNMQLLSINEINNQQEFLFEIDTLKLLDREQNNIMLSRLDLFKTIFNGFYPRIYKDKKTDIQKFYQNYIDDYKFYQNYIDDYISHNVKQYINIKDKYKFLEFMKLLATQNNQEFVKENFCKNLKLETRTIDSWITALIAGDIIYFLQPYFEINFNKRIVRKNKIYFNDTGLLCYLLKIENYKELNNSIYKESIFKTFVFNEIKKTYKNQNVPFNVYFYRDKNNKEIDFIILQNSKLNLIKVGCNNQYSLSDIKSFNVLNNSQRIINGKCIICTTNNSYPLKDGLFVFPYNVI